MPAVYQDTAFADLGRRLQAIAETAKPIVHGYYELLAQFNDWLLSRRTPNGTLNIVANETVNFPALRMATNVAIRHLVAESLKPMAAAASEPSPTRPVAATTPPTAPQPLAEHRPSESGADKWSTRRSAPTLSGHLLDGVKICSHMCVSRADVFAEFPLMRGSLPPLSKKPKELNPLAQAQLR